MSGNDKHFDRRSVLKSIGATAAASIGLSATATSAAAEEADRIAHNYADETRLRFAFEQHAEGLKRTLVAEGFVAEDFEFGSLDFELDESVNGLHPKSADGLAGVTGAVEGGTPTAFAVVSASSDTHEISMVVQPERDEAYAFVEPEDSDDRFVVTDSEVTPQGCAYDQCQDTCCSATTRKRYIYNCDADCQNCYLYDQDCHCSC